MRTATLKQQSLIVALLILSAGFLPVHAEVANPGSCLKFKNAYEKCEECTTFTGVRLRLEVANTCEEAVHCRHVPYEVMEDGTAISQNETWIALNAKEEMWGTSVVEVTAYSPPYEVVYDLSQCRMGEPQPEI